MKIFWTDQALSQLEKIFDYYKINVSIKTARKISKNLVDCTLKLQNNPKLGKIEELLEERIEEFRFLIEGNYKIIYWVNKRKHIVFIAAVFDCRQDPKKLHSNIKE
jgi:toxin ParE1/3/4